MSANDLLFTLDSAAHGGCPATSCSASSGLVTGNSIERTNLLRRKQGREELPPQPWEGESVSWSHHAGGTRYFFSGKIVEVIQPDDDPSDLSRRWWNIRTAYGAKLAGEGKSKHPRCVVWLDSGKGYRFPLLHRITFRQNEKELATEPAPTETDYGNKQ